LKTQVAYSSETLQCKINGYDILCSYSKFFLNLCRSKQSHYLTHSSIRSFDGLYSVYRRLWILTTTVNQEFKYCLVLLQNILLFIILFLNYSAICGHGNAIKFTVMTAIFCSFTMFTYWTLVLLLFSRVNVKCRRVFNSWNNYCDPSLEGMAFKKFLVAVKPIAFAFGDFSHISPVSIILYFHGVLKGTFRLTLIFPCRSFF